jgi:hypothetical protein
MRTKLIDKFHNEKYRNYHYADTLPSESTRHASPPLFVDDVDNC